MSSWTNLHCAYLPCHIHMPRVFISCPSVCSLPLTTLPRHCPFFISLSPPLTILHSQLSTHFSTLTLHSRTITHHQRVGLACTVRSRQRNNTNPLPDPFFFFLFFSSSSPTHIPVPYRPISTRKKWLPL